MTNTNDVRVIRITTKGKAKKLRFRVNCVGVFFLEEGQQKAISRCYFHGEISQLLVCNDEAVIKVSAVETCCSSHFKLVDHVNSAEFFLRLSTAISVPITSVCDPATLLRKNDQNKTKQYLYPRDRMKKLKTPSLC